LAKSLRTSSLSIVPDQRAEDAGVAVRRAQRFRAALAEGAIRARLDACLVPGKPAMDVAEWAKLMDPFATWRRADEAA